MGNKLKSSWDMIHNGVENNNSFCRLLYKRGILLLHGEQKLESMHKDDF